MSIPFLPSAVHAQYQWDSSTQVILPDSGGPPALAYDPALGKMFLAWGGTDTNHLLNFLTSSDLVNWPEANKVVLTVTDNGDLTDMTYDSSNGKVYASYENVNAPPAPSTATGDLYTESSSDGISWTQQAVYHSGGLSIAHGVSITYNTPSNLLVAAAYNIGGNGEVDVITSSNGGTSWSTPNVVNYGGSQVTTYTPPMIRYFNGVYLLSYTTGGNNCCENINIIQSTNLVAWTSQSSPPQTTENNRAVSITLDSAEGLYHMNWVGSFNHYINDATSSYGVVWSSPNTFQSAFYLDSAYDPALSSLLLAWTGTNGCFGTCSGNINVMQYHSVGSSPPPGSGGGGGSVAQGTLITLADGTRVPVQNVVVGDRLRVFNVPTGYETNATVSYLHIVSTNDTLTIHTTADLPFRADANPHMKLWVYSTNGPYEKPITLIEPGDMIYNFYLKTWVTVIHVNVEYGGQHTMYDLGTNPAFTSSGLLLEFIANGYPDCLPCKT